MRRSIAALALLALASCATIPRADTPEKVQPVTVYVPTPVACVDPKDVPAMPAKVGNQLNGDAAHDLDIVAAALVGARHVIDEALALLGGCTTKPPAP